MSILWAITWIAGIGFVTFIWLQIKAAGKAAEVVERQHNDLESAVRIAEATADTPTGKRGVLDRLHDGSRQL